jgi:hypothetical protein
MTYRAAKEECQTEAAAASKNAGILEGTYVHPRTADSARK